MLSLTPPRHTSTLRNSCNSTQFLPAGVDVERPLLVAPHVAGIPVSRHDRDGGRSPQTHANAARSGRAPDLAQISAL